MTRRGLVSTLQAAINTWGAEMALRFIMGAAEAGYGPGIPYLLSFFYLRHELGFRCGIFLAAAPLANTFAGALAYGITSGHTSIAHWRVLFLVEGLPTIVMAAVAFVFVPDSPEKARFLNDEEKEIAASRRIRQTGTSPRVGSVDWTDFWKGLIDPKAWFTAVSTSIHTLVDTHTDGIFSSCTSAAMSALPRFLSSSPLSLPRWDFPTSMHRD